MDLRIRVDAFRLQDAQRLLTQPEVRWRGVAWTLLRRAGGLNYERQFLTHPGKLDLAELTPFYRSMMLVWQKIDNNKGPVLTRGVGVAGATFSTTCS